MKIPLSAILLSFAALPASLLAVDRAFSCAVLGVIRSAFIALVQIAWLVIEPMFRGIRWLAIWFVALFAVTVCEVTTEKTAARGISSLANFARAGVALAFVIGISIAAQPVVNNVRLDNIAAPDGSLPHSAVRVRWDVSVATCFHRVLFGLTTSYTDQVGSPGAGGCPGDAGSQINDLGVTISGLAPNTTYHICPESSADNITYSTCVDQVWTTAALPAVHPAPPQIPNSALYFPTFPLTSGYSVYTFNSSCLETSPSAGLTLTQGIAAAVAAQPTGGVVISIDPAAVCAMPSFADDTQMVSTPMDSGHVNTTTGEFTSTVQGWVLANGQTVIVSGSACIPDSLTHGNGDNAYNPNPQCFANGQITSGVVYYLVQVSGTTKFKLSRTLGGSPIIPGDTGATSGIMLIGQWPTINSNWIVIQSSVPDTTFCPQGVRCMGSVWSSKMPTLRVTGGCFNCASPLTGNFTHHIYFRGIQITSTDVSALANTTVDPQPSNRLIFAPASWMSSYIVFDRCYIYGQPFPNRYTDIITQLGGRNIAIINSDLEGLDMWFANATPTVLANPSLRAFYPTNPVTPWSANVLTLLPGTFYLGPVNTCTVSGNSVVTLTGGSASGTFFVYLDSSCVPTAVFPTGTTGTFTSSATDKNSLVHTGVFTTAASPAYPRDGSNGINAGTIGQGNITSGTGTSFSSEATFVESNWSCSGTGACSMDNGTGPGPMSFINDYWEGTGLLGPFQTDGSIVDPAGVLVQQNTFFWNQQFRVGSPTSNNLQYRNRNGPESKHARQYRFIGNIVQGSWACISAGGPAVLQHSGANNGTTGTVGGTGYPGYTVQDIDYRYNTFLNTTTAIEVGNNSYANLTTIPVAARIRIQDNLFANINGYTQNDGNCGNAGNGGSSGYVYQFDGPLEDPSIDHNTIYDNRGVLPLFFHTVGSAYVEGLAVTNNLIFANLVTQFATSDGPGPWFPALVGTPNTPVIGNSGKTFLNSTFVSGPGNPSYTFAGNVLVPYYSSFTVPSNPTGWITAQSMCTALGGGTMSGDNCPGGVIGTILNHGTAPANLAQIQFTNPAAVSATLFNPAVLKLLYTSPYISGAHVATDGTDAGADMNGLLTAQGAVDAPTVGNITATGAVANWFAHDGSFACYVDYATSPNDPSTQTGGGRVQALTDNSQSVTLSGLSAGTAYNYRVLCPVNQPTGRFVTQ